MMTAMSKLTCKSNSTLQRNKDQERLFQDNKNYWDISKQSSSSSSGFYTRNPRQINDYTVKRKSAVELLQESKAFYVKSEVVLDRKQELKNSGHLQVAPSIAPAAPRLLRKSINFSSIQQGLTPLSSNINSTSSYWTNCQEKSDKILNCQRALPLPVLPPKSPRLISLPQRRAISVPPNTSNNDQLQIKLRRLLNTDSKENVFFPDNNLTSISVNDNLTRDEIFHHYPSGNSLNTREDDNNINLHCQSPKIRLKFGRSNSHSHSSRKNSSVKLQTSPPPENSICHKSLPDLHTSGRNRSNNLSASKALPLNHNNSSGHYLDCETSSDYSEHSFKRDSIHYQSNSRCIRRSFGSNSVLSLGGRTQKSSGSSKLSHVATARDSGGSSGHCTHRSEPPSKIHDYWSHTRRDSGASTQHSTEKSRKESYVNINVTFETPKNINSNSDSASNSQTDCSPPCPSRFSDGWKEGHGRPIFRSKSDISDRYWRYENNRSMKNQSKSPRSLTELENFFDKLGLDSDNYEQLTMPNSNTSSPVFFDSVSSVDSALGLYPWSGNNSTGGQQWTGNNCIGGANDDTSHRLNDPPSVVERNARIIKWLCQCRKVQFGYS